MTTTPYQTPEQPRRTLAMSIAIAAGVVAAVMRVVPHPPNFSGVGALGLFGGARLSGWRAYILPIGIMVLSDLALWTLTGFDPKYSLGHMSRAYVYASFMAYVLIGRWLIRENSSATVIVLAATLGGVQFFFFTNFCNWLFQPLEVGYDQLPSVWRYSRDFDGLMHCFAMALPFTNRDTPTTDHPFMLFTDFRLSLIWTCVGDTLFSLAYFYIYAQRKLRAPAPMPATAASNG